MKQTSLGSEVKALIRSFLSQHEFNFPHPGPGTDFHQLAVQEANRRGITMDVKGGKEFLGACLSSGERMAMTTYAHVENKSTQMLICLFTACVIYVDDSARLKVESREDIKKFHERFVCQEPQPTPVLAVLGDLLKEMYQHFGYLEAGFIITSTLNLCTAVNLETCIEELKINATEPSYAAFYRTMSGNTDAFGFFIFPPRLPISEYIQAMPDLGVFLNYTNDILSFYKEEIAGDNVNYVSLLATTKQISKLEALRILVDECITAHENIVRILAPSKEASAAYQKFSQGYLAYHVYTKRYRLNELGFDFDLKSC